MPKMTTLSIFIYLQFTQIFFFTYFFSLPNIAKYQLMDKQNTQVTIYMYIKEYVYKDQFLILLLKLSWHVFLYINS